MRFVPENRKNENVPCWFIPLSENGQTVDYFSSYGTQLELEEALAAWLRNEIHKIEDRQDGKTSSAAGSEDEEVCRLAGT
jgi:hypothetical protein